MENNNNWLKNLRGGDKVIVNDGRPKTPGMVMTVARVTKTQIVLEDFTIKFRLDDGRAVGVSSLSFYRHCLEEATPERVEAIRIFRIRHWLANNCDWSKLSTQQIEDIFQITQEGRC